MINFGSDSVVLKMHLFGHVTFYFDGFLMSTHRAIDKTHCMNKIGSQYSVIFGSGKLTGGAPGLQIRCAGLKPRQVGSIPMHFRHQ